MYNSKSATVSKNLFFVACGLALIFLLALVWCLAELNEKPPQSVLDKVAADPETMFVSAIKEDATVGVFLPDGSPAKSCGNINGTNGTTVEGNCDIKGRFVNLNTVTIFTTESSPGCTTVSTSAGYALFRKCS